MKTVFCCQSCGYQAPKWMGRCPECEGWGTFVEEPADGSASAAKSGRGVKPAEAVALDAIELADERRIHTAIGEFDRVLGGGIVAGSLVLVGGDPGIGKSTLMLQAAQKLSENGCTVLYVSGEESLRQIKMRSRRLCPSLSSSLLAAAETDIERVTALARSAKPDVMVIDSIQTMSSGDFSSAPGSVGQVREATMRLMALAKKTGICVFLIGHVTKDGSIAGPRIMEHMVDTVLYFEGDKNQVFRILRAVKNRFGSTNEIGVFEMRTEGLGEVANPSAVFLSEMPEKTPGSVVTASMEGTRPILVELQALASRTSLGMARRTILGLDANRVALLVAVMEKKLGMELTGYDVFMNVAGGVRVSEPAVDLAVIAAVASSFLDRPIPTGTVVLGEVGLTGEVRAINHIDTRVGEIKKMGFTACLLPQGNLKRMSRDKEIKVTGVGTVAEAMEVLFQ
ncbi:DNA repair protein RadA [Desulfosudis oleivorans]|uniref:DNA repair protein RadA n=1 Tax=Desulfosudis oleivorans (strain DSM 6200 / JCM 39069 / Hxd3) TaxID=96561 RepID=A8ZT19_DESOH|nr:DNA repair protein RadA [Desulfosudis oleivorans]ABW66183.1 DNA repair protein RadA [Desulfosudis oleivorans Hxd3]